MNTKEMISELACRLDYTNKDVNQLIISMMEIMGEKLQEGKILDFQEFGVFEVKKKMEYITVDPLTKQRLLMPPELVLDFNPSPNLKDKFRKVTNNE